jgi:tRNA G18 (ribose-2'-O)-methylase SpoU
LVPAFVPGKFADYHCPVPVLHVADAADPRLADYRGVPDPELARARGVFVAEGRLVVRRLLGSRFVTRSVMVTPTALGAVTDLVNSQPCLAVFVVTQEVMNAIAGFNIHRGCLAIGERPAPRPWYELARHGRSLVALERVGNADNVGATFRAAAAFDADGVLLDAASADPLYRKAIRTSMGASLQVGFAAGVPWPGALTGLGSHGWAVVGLTPAAAAPLAPVLASVGGRRVTLVLGHEGDGLTPEAMAACTHLARIPMPGGVDSLNVAMAAGIALYELRRASPGTA